MFELASLSVIFDLNHVKAAFAVDSISIAALYVENADAFMSIFEIFPCKSTERMCNNEKLSVTKLFLLVIASIVRLITRFWAIFSQAPISTYSFKSFDCQAKKVWAKGTYKDGFPAFEDRVGDQLDPLDQLLSRGLLYPVFGESIHKGGHVSRFVFKFAWQIIEGVAYHTLKEIDQEFLALRLKLWRALKLLEQRLV